MTGVRVKDGESFEDLGMMANLPIRHTDLEARPVCHGFRGAFDVCFPGRSIVVCAPSFTYQFEASMADQAALAEIEKRIQVVEDNLRQLVEQAAAYSGAADEERNADRIADQQAKLDALLAEREALLK